MEHSYPLLGNLYRHSILVHPLLHPALIYVLFTKEGCKTGFGVFVQQDKELVPGLLVTFVCCHNYL